MLLALFAFLCSPKIFGNTRALETNNLVDLWCPVTDASLGEPCSRTDCVVCDTQTAKFPTPSALLVPPGTWATFLDPTLLCRRYAPTLHMIVLLSDDENVYRELRRLPDCLSQTASQLRVVSVVSVRAIELAARDIVESCQQINSTTASEDTMERCLAHADVFVNALSGDVMASGDARHLYSMWAASMRERYTNGDLAQVLAQRLQFDGADGRIPLIVPSMQSTGAPIAAIVIGIFIAVSAFAAFFYWT